MKKIIHANIITPKQVLNNYEIIFNDQEILLIQPTSSLHEKNMEIIDAKHQFVMPGFIDIHSDYIEHIAAPRSKIIMPLHLALHEFEKECLVHGITTMYHSVSLWKGAGSKPLRDHEYIFEFAKLIKQSHEHPHLIHNRLHIRYEIDNLEQVETLLNLIEADMVHLLSFMDHTPGQGQYRDIETYVQYLKKASHLDETSIRNILFERLEAPKLSLDVIRNIAEIAHKKNIPIASHDDDSIEKLHLVKEFHTVISEFPITLEIAKHARNLGFYTLVGAPNVLLGASSTGNLSAIEAITHQAADILCSDYYPPALLHAVFKLIQKGFNTTDIVNMISLNPAKALKIDHYTGSIEISKSADLMIVDTSSMDTPIITHVFVSGQLVHQLHLRSTHE